MLDGGVNSTTSELIVGKTTSSRGLYICTSGSFTGTNCDIRVIDYPYIYSLRGFEQYSISGVRAWRVRSDLISVGTGDSGGPVLENAPTPRQVKAVGMISGGQSEVPCPSGTLSGKCFNTLLYVDTNRILVDGLTLFY